MSQAKRSARFPGAILVVVVALAVGACRVHRVIDFAASTAHPKAIVDAAPDEGSWCARRAAPPGSLSGRIVIRPDPGHPPAPACDASPAGPEALCDVAHIEKTITLDFFFRSRRRRTHSARPRKLELRHADAHPGAAIPHVLEGRDLLGIAQTGTGKTAAFALPMLQRLAENAAAGARRECVRAGARADPRAGLQIAEASRTYGRHRHFARPSIYGGVGQGPQVSALRARRRHRRRHAGPPARPDQPGPRRARHGRDASCSTKPTACSTWASSTTSARSSSALPEAAADAALLGDHAAADRATSPAAMLRDPVRVEVAPRKRRPT